MNTNLKINNKYHFWNKFYKIRYWPSLTKEVTNKEFRVVKEFLPISKYKRILDFMCGFGRHAIKLAKIGYEVEGFDLDEESIRIAKKQAVMEGLNNIKLYVEDALKFNNKEKFDAAICLYSAIGCLDKKNNEKVFRNLLRSVKKGGRVILDFINPSYALKHLVSDVVKIKKFKDRIYVIKHRRKILFNPIREMNFLSIVDQQTKKEYKTKYVLHLYSASELEGRLKKYGFVTRKTFGSFDKDRVDDDHPRIIMIADKVI